MLFIIIDEADLENRTNQLITDISNCNREHIIQCYIKTQSNIPEEPCYISYMTPTSFINVQYESRCSIKSSYQVLFFISFSDI